MRGYLYSHKGPNLTGIDPDSGMIVPLFSPRQQRWADHFALREAMIVGLTPVGRTTVHVLAMGAETGGKDTHRRVARKRGWLRPEPYLFVPKV